MKKNSGALEAPPYTTKAQSIYPLSFCRKKQEGRLFCFWMIYMIVNRWRSMGEKSILEVCVSKKPSGSRFFVSQFLVVCLVMYKISEHVFKGREVVPAFWRKKVEVLCLLPLAVLVES